GHVCALIDEGVKTIFYPCLTYNFDEGLSDNHYNCPVVAYYPEVISLLVFVVSLYRCYYIPKSFKMSIGFPAEYPAIPLIYLRIYKKIL
ncbi:acyl-CoA dehydratase activase-related protein, partial [Blautia sp.]|uniref:acyl-CoA dehydratase activase-related protein n=1 Tax=Blautia sp. TaxID=1955243 RepID=UPI003AB2D65C